MTNTLILPFQALQGSKEDQNDRTRLCAYVEPDAVGLRRSSSPDSQPAGDTSRCGSSDYKLLE